MLGGCVSIVKVCSTDATVTTHTGIGLASSPHMASLGLYRAQVVAFPKDACGVAVVQNPPAESVSHLKWLSDQTTVKCLSKEPPK
jgi:hypothetical protein